MTVPTRREAARLLLSLEPPAWFLNHACAVADVAAWLAVRAEARGAAVDPRAIATAALLHDVDKLPSARADAHLRHGEGSADWLERRGMDELAPLVRDHPVTHLAEDRLATRLAAGPAGARIVAYADKRAGQRIESMDQRFASWRRRYPAGLGAHVQPLGGGPRGEGWADDITSLVWARALALELEVCALAGTAPVDVGRLRWSRLALRAAVGGAGR